MLAVNVDFRYPQGYPDWREARRLGIGMVRCISLPENEDAAAGYLGHGVRVLAVYTGESNAAGRYIMSSASAIQIGNEPGYVYPDGAASWPTGTSDDMVNVWSHVANVLVPQVHPNGIPLIGPGLWVNDSAKWALIASRLPKLSAAAVHCYPDFYPTPMSLSAFKVNLKAFAAVRPDLPVICTEWTARQPRTLSIARAIDAVCDARYWYDWGDPGQPQHMLQGTTELGILALVG